MQRLAFFHIAKTAGSTLRSIMQRNYALGELYPMYTEQARTGFRTMPKARKDKIKVVYGHFCMDRADWFPGDMSFVSILREPVERVISLYYFYRYVRKTEPAARLSLRGFIEEGNDLQTDNWMVRCFSGAAEGIAMGQCTADMLNAAKRNADRFALIGLSERFDESYALLCQMFGWPVRYVPPLNVNPHRPALETLGAEDIAAAERVNRFDREFYRYCAGRLEARLAQADISAQLHDLRKRRESFWYRSYDILSQRAQSRWRRLARKLFGMRQYG